MQQWNPITILAAYLFVINTVTFLAFGLDKASARRRARRTSEKALWLLALLGGSLGAIGAMRFFRHKTQKLSFQFVLLLIITIQIVFLSILLHE